MRRYAAWALPVLALTGFGFGLLPAGVSQAQPASVSTARAKATASAKATTAPKMAATAASAGTSPASAESPTAAVASGPAAAVSGTAAPTASATPAAGGTSSGPSMDGATYSVKLRDLEARVDELKDQIRRSHTRLSLLSDTILSGGIGGSRAEVAFKNELSGAYKLVRALVIIDGAVQYQRQDETGALADQKEIPIFTGAVPPGDHTVQFVLDLQGSGSGVFSYMRGYKFQVKQSHAFTAVEGKNLALTATVYEKGGVTTPFEQRPTIEWQEKVAAITQSGASSAPSTSSTPAAGGTK